MPTFEEEEKKRKAEQDAILRALMESQTAAESNLLAGAQGRNAPNDALATILSLPRATAQTTQQRLQTQFASQNQRAAEQNTALQGGLAGIQRYGDVAATAGNQLRDLRYKQWETEANERRLAREEAERERQFELQAQQARASSGGGGGRSRGRSRGGGRGRGGGGGRRGGGSEEFAQGEVKWLADLVDAGDISLDDVPEGERWKVQAEIRYRGRTYESDKAQADYDAREAAWDMWMDQGGPTSGNRSLMGVIGEKYGSDAAQAVRDRANKYYPKKTTQPTKPKPKLSFWKRAARQTTPAIIARNVRFVNKRAKKKPTTKKKPTPKPSRMR